MTTLSVACGLLIERARLLMHWCTSLYIHHLSRGTHKAGQCRYAARQTLRQCDLPYKALHRAAGAAMRRVGTFFPDDARHVQVHLLPSHRLEFEVSSAPGLLALQARACTTFELLP